MLNIKRTIVFMLIITLTISLALSGCSSPQTNQSAQNEQPSQSSEENNQTKAPEPIEALMVTANIGGNMHVIGGAIGKLIEENIPGSHITVQPGESGGNPIVLNEGGADIGTTMYSNATSAVAGKEPYPTATTNVSALANFNINQWITFITTNKDYNTLQEMIDAKHPIKLVLAKAGSSSETLVRYILEGYGVTYEDIKSWGGSVTHVSHSDAVNLMKDRHADVYASIPSLRFPAVLDLTTSAEVKFLLLDKDIIDKIAEEKGLLTGTLPANTYKGQDQDYYSLMETQLLICKTDKLSEEAAYNIVKLICENKDKLVNAHADMSTFDVNTACKDTGFPLHPGAEKYYKEIGALN
ncbi:MAG: TAXI family TRAP transporter solute-binding subunit [Clostridiales bacterium]|nr:TAXI family TRAP transporter solute-binding subunit [Clostridiales bacterium]